jgi:hypothetical protein
MRFVYKIFSRVSSGIAARVGKSLFKSLWSQVDHEDPPPPSRLDASLGKVIVGASLEAATMAGVAAIVERATASTFHYLFGVAPEPRRKKPSSD